MKQGSKSSEASDASQDYETDSFCDDSTTESSGSSAVIISERNQSKNKKRSGGTARQDQLNGKETSRSVLGGDTPGMRDPSAGLRRRSTGRYEIGGKKDEQLRTTETKLNREIERLKKIIAEQNESFVKIQEDAFSRMKKNAIDAMADDEVSSAIETGFDSLEGWMREYAIKPSPDWKLHKRAVKQILTGKHGRPTWVTEKAIEAGKDGTLSIRVMLMTAIVRLSLRDIFEQPFFYLRDVREKDFLNDAGPVMEWISSLGYLSKCVVL
jgi:hypothetical protein